MAGLTRSLVTRHALGRADAYDAALLDVAQDHLLYLLVPIVARAGSIVSFIDSFLMMSHGSYGSDRRHHTGLCLTARWAMPG